MKAKQAELLWANDVLEVYSNLGTPVVDQRWSTGSAKHMHGWTREEQKNEGVFLKDFVPKATDIIKKSDAGDIDDAVVLMDSKTVKDLQILLRDALHASEDGVYKEEVSEPPKTEALQETAPGGLMDEPTLEDLF